MLFRTRRLAAASVVVTAATALVAGCTSGGGSTSGASGDTLTLWTHNAGNAVELDVVKKIIKDFNGSQDKYKVKLQAFPQSDYNNSVVAAASARKLPCLLDVDGPNVANWAWGGYLSPIDVSGSEVPLSDQLASTVGEYKDKLYAFGFYDVSLAFFARKSVLDANGVRVPTVDKPWTKGEFDAALAKLKKSGKFEYPLEMGTGGTGEWWSYAYSPQLQSFGGDLVDRGDYKTASGTLDGENAVEWASWFHSLVAKDYMAKKSGADPNKDFLAGEERHPVGRQLERGQERREARRRPGDHPAGGLRQRTQDRRRLLAVGDELHLLQQGRCAGVAEVLPPDEVLRRLRQGHQHHPCHRRRCTADRGLPAGRQVRRARPVRA